MTPNQPNATCCVWSVFCSLLISSVFRAAWAVPTSCSICCTSEEHFRIASIKKVRVPREYLWYRSSTYMICVYMICIYIFIWFLSIWYLFICYLYIYIWYLSILYSLYDIYFIWYIFILYLFIWYLVIWYSYDVFRFLCVYNVCFIYQRCIMTHDMYYTLVNQVWVGQLALAAYKSGYIQTQCHFPRWTMLCDMFCHLTNNNHCAKRIPRDLNNNW